jgi:hypothetical protein
MFNIHFLSIWSEILLSEHEIQRNNAFLLNQLFIKVCIKIFEVNEHLPSSELFLIPFNYFVFD